MGLFIGTAQARRGSSGGSQAWSYPGIPYPTDGNSLTSAWPYDPCTITRPANPAEWPSAANSAFYYVNNSHGAATDTANTYGYPAKPRLTIPVALSAGDTVVIGGGTNYTTGSPRFTLTATGTATDRIFIINESGSQVGLLKELRFDGSSHIVVDGLHFSQSGQTIQVQNGASFITVRNCTATGPGVAAGNNTVFASSGASDAALTHHVMFYKNTVQTFGDYLSASENDYHAFMPGAYTRDTWFIGNTTNRNGGDGIQVGQATYTGTQRPYRVYIAGNDFSEDRENAIDIKRSVDVICSGNVGRDYLSSSSSEGAAAVVHNEAENVWFIGNTLHSSAIGVINTGTVNFYALGNLIYNCTGSTNISSYYDSGAAIHVRGSSGDIYLSANTIDGCDHGIQIPTLTPTEVFSNVITGTVAGYDLAGGGSGTFTASNTDNNLSDSWSVRLAGTVGTTPPGASDVEGAPLFTNQSTRDYTLQATSPAVDAGKESAAYAIFQTRYGMDIRVDRAGTARPAASGDWDIGAYERAA